MKYLFALFSLFILRTELSGQTTFINNQDWESIKESAKIKQKLIFIDAYTDWCGWCKVMDENTFSNAAIGNMMDQHFINVKLEMEKDELGKQLALKYTISSFPSYLVFNSDGALIYQTGGYEPPSDFMNTLFAIIKPENHVNRPGYSPGFSVEYPEFYLSAMGMTKKKKFPKEEEILEWASANKDLGNEANWAVYKRFYWAMNETYRENFWSQMAKLDTLYGHDMVSELSLNLLYEAAGDLVKKNNPQKFEAFLKSHLSYVDKPKEVEKGVRLYYAQETQNWKEVNRILSARFKEEGPSKASYWNQVCWEIYEKSNDSLLIKNAVKWIEEAIKIDPDYNHLDTYAALLFKAGNLGEAKLAAEHAIRVGKQGGKNVKATETLLAEIEAAMLAREAEKPGTK